MKSFFPFFTAIMLGFTSLSTCQAMCDDTEAAVAKVARQSQGLNAEKLAEMRGHVHGPNRYGYVFSNDSKKQEFQILLYVYRNTIIEILDEQTDSLEKWTKETGYKNFPTLETDGREIVEFSARHRPLLARLNQVRNQSMPFVDNMYDAIGEESTNFYMLLDQARLSLNIVGKAQQLINDLTITIHVFSKKDQVIMDVLNQAQARFFKTRVGYAGNQEAYITEIQGSLNLDNKEEWRKDPELRERIKKILDKNIL